MKLVHVMFSLLLVVGVEATETESTVRVNEPNPKLDLKSLSSADRFLVNWIVDQYRLEKKQEELETKLLKLENELAVLKPKKKEPAQQKEMLEQEFLALLTKQLMQQPLPQDSRMQSLYEAPSLIWQRGDTYVRARLDLNKVCSFLSVAVSELVKDPEDDRRMDLVVGRLNATIYQIQRIENLLAKEKPIEEKEIKSRALLEGRLERILNSSVQIRSFLIRAVLAEDSKKD